MARIKDTSVDAVKAAASIVDLVETRTRLRKVGARYTGLCPFHQEKTPSFSVSPDRGTYHCFGCGVGGDAISFVRETEGLDFVGAIEWLADHFHVPLEYEESSPQADAQRRQRDRLYSLLDHATSFYERVLWSESGAAAQEYLASRGLAEDVCREFRLGLSTAGETLAKKARDKGFTQDELATAGLVSRRGSDYFQRRLMFPLTDARGRVIAFQARKLHEEDPLRGKYVNSPESELFHKSNVLYGFHLARAAIAREERALVVEGNTDVIALRQAGLQPVVASMGTALTERQLKELARLTQRVFLCFDSDAAGEDATLRGMELALRQGLDVRVVALPKGRDPADDPAGFEERLGSAEAYAVHRVRLELDRAEDRQLAYLRVQDVLNGIPESPERHDAWRLANDRLGLTVQLRATGGAASASSLASPRLIDAGARLERDALAGCVAHPELVRILAEISAEHFDADLNRRLRAHLVEEGEEADGELVPLLAELDARAAADAIDEATGKELLLRLRERHLRRELAVADPERTKELQEALQRIRTAVSELV
ncbi:MAG TPA: DNA primase [Gaiellaceae bacterium]|nr:DNA primase [Gaiellaceae bacterium]